MRHPLLSGCSRGLIASILAAALCAAAPASAEIFKCFAKDKTPIYQNFPCQFDSNPRGAIEPQSRRRPSCLPLRIRQSRRRPRQCCIARQTARSNRA